MQDWDLLLTLAEVAVAFAGFASLVSVLGRRRARDEPHINSIRMRAMVLYSLIVIAFSLLPFVLHRWEVGEPAIWRGLSAPFAGAVGVTAAWLVRQVRYARSLNVPTRRPILRIVVVPIGTLVAAALLLGANATVLGPSVVSAVYLTGLGMLLFLAGFAFALVIFSFLGHIESE